MEIKVAKYSGFCFGVKRAVNMVYKLINENGDSHIFTLGNLIHNKNIINDLTSKGVNIIYEDELDDLFQKCGENYKCIILIRAHGIDKFTNGRLIDYSEKNKFFKVVDCTCPDVKKIHNIVSEHSVAGNDSLTIIIGDADHPEVTAIRSYIKGNSLICLSAEELTGFVNDIADKHIIMVAQTTQKLSEWKICQKIIKKVCTNPKIFDTICSVTENRQSEVDNLSKNVDMMLIIGDKASSNTNKLFDISHSNLLSTFFIESISDLPLHKVTSHVKVGIAAGASTPSSIIEEVINKMSEQENKTGTIDNIIEKEQTFAEMLEDSLKTLTTGETVKGIITFISSNEIQVDLGAKVTGIIPNSELPDHIAENVAASYKVGDEIEAIVVKVSDLDGVATLSRRRIENILNWRMIIEANKNNTVLEGKIIDSVKSGLIISINGVRVFIPASQSGIAKEGDLSQLVGTTQRVKIIEINEQRRRSVASIRLVQREERKQKETEFWENIEENKQYEGIVKSLTPYGAFVDLGGVDGMVHTSELSWSRIKHPSEVVNIGDKVTVFVKEFDKETKRISLGYKTEESDPWVIFNNKYALGDVVSVKVVGMTPFGAFVEVVPGADGLIHISQIADRKINQPSDVLTIGQMVEAKIINIDTDKKKIGLSIRTLIEEARAAEDAEAIAFIKSQMEKEEAGEQPEADESADNGEN